MAIIRDMKLSELSMIAKINVETFRETQRGIVPDSFLQELSVEKAERRFYRMLARSERQSQIFVGEVDGEVVGYAMAGLAREAVYDFEGELYGIYILPEYHGRGVGRGLMNAVQTHMRDLGVSSMFVWVFSDNTPARKYYEAMGGQYILERPIAVGGRDVLESAYGWRDLHR